MDFDNYDLDPSIYDEMFLPDGTPREHCRRLYETLTQLSVEQIGSIQERGTRSFENEGITFTVYGDDEADERIIPIDCLPRVMSSADWRQLEQGLTQRVRTLNLFLEDVYGESRSKGIHGEPRIVSDGVVPVDVVRGCPQYRVEMRGFSAPYGTWVAICGTDLVRTNDGFRVLEDNLRVPSGVSYMLATGRRPRRACAACIEYVPGSTSAISPIDHILESGRCVCQDYAHVMIVIARSWGVPTRYVSGYVHVSETGKQTPESASDAWVECLLPDLGWVGFDPTNRSLADERCVRIAVGCDHQDVSPTRGVLVGGGESSLEVSVRMRVVDQVSR